MSVVDVQNRLRSLFEENKRITQLTTKLAKVSAPAEAATSEGETRVSLGAEIHQSLKDLEEDYELLKQDADDFSSLPAGASGRRGRDPEKEQERLTITTQLGRLGEDIRIGRAQFRKAQLQAKRGEEAAKRKERERLFADLQGGGGRGPGRRKGQEKLSQDELVVGAAGDVTLALRRTHQLMQTELQRSEFAHETLQRSTAALDDLSQNYSNLDTLLSRSRNLVRSLRTSQKSDTWYLETALYVLVATLGWLVFRRIAYYPLYYLAYKPFTWLYYLLLAVANATVGVLVGSAGATAGLPSGSTGLKVRQSATGKGPTRIPGMAAPSMNVGGGGKDEKTASASGSGPLSEQVGRMAEEAKKDGEQDQQDGQPTGLRERRADEPVNPKKRMWEEPPPPEAGRDKDEL